VFGVAVLLLVAALAGARDVSGELSQAPAAAVAAPFMKVQWVVNQTAVDAGQGLFHQPWSPNVKLPLNITVTRYVLPVPWQVLFARAVPVDVSNPTGATALYINVYITMNTTSLISQGLMRSDCRDVVATTEWGDPLPTWVENCNTASSRVWVMVPVLPPGTWRIWLHHGCPNCQFTADPRAVFLYYEDMQTPPKGILASSASYDATNKYVSLAPPSTNQLGYLVYKVPPAQFSALYVKFNFYIGTCSPYPAHGIWVAAWDSDYVGISEDVVKGGYHLTADVYQTRVCFTKSTTDNGPGVSCASVSISQGVWHTYEGYMWLDGAGMHGVIYYDGQKLVDAVDTQPQQNPVAGSGLLVFGGRTGTTSYCNYILGPFYVAHLDPRITASAGQPASPPPPLAPPRVGLVTHRIYINSTRALLDGASSPGVLATPFTYTLHTAVASLSVKAGSGMFCVFNASGVASGCQATGVLSRGIDAAYYDPMAWNAPFLDATFIVYKQQEVSLGFSGMWTPGDSYRGWVSVWQWGGVWLNVTQVSGHGAAAPGSRVSATAGTYAVAYSGDGTCTFYVNGTAYSSATCTAPSGTPKLLTPVGPPGIRTALRSAWISIGTASVLTESSMYIDFRFSPQLSSLGVFPSLPAVKMGGSPGMLASVTVTGAVKTTGAIWGPFGEVCPGRLPNGTLIAFGVRYAWQSPSAQPSCSAPLQTAPPAGAVSTVLFNSTVPIQLYFTSPPIQHPLLANSVPGARFCSLNATHFTVPYLSLKVPGSTAVSDQWACAPSDYFVGGYVAQVARGWALIVPVMRVFRVNTTSVVYMGSGSAVLARGGTVPAMSARAADGKMWHIYTSGTAAVVATSLQTPPNVPNSGGLVSGIFGVPRSPSTLLSVWWADGARYYVTAAGLASDPIVYISSFTGSPVAVYAELNAPLGYSYQLAVLDNGTYVWGVPVSGSSFTIYIPTSGYYTVRLYRDGVKVWEKMAYLSPDGRLTVGPIEMAVFTPVNPVSLYTPAAPKPPVFVPAVSMQMPPHAIGVLMLGIFAAAYVTMREVSLAALITGAVVAVLGVLINAPIYSVAGVFLLAFGLWNKSRRQSSA